MRWLAFALLAGCGFHAGPGLEAADAPPKHDALAIDTAAADPDTRSPPPDATDCPASYTIAVGTSRYRNSDDDSNSSNRLEHAHAAFDDCVADSASPITHLVALDDATELAGLLPHLTAGHTYWVGATQRRDQGTPSEGWLKITDPDAAHFYASWAAQQPDDNNHDENNSENFAMLSPDGTEDDQAGTRDRSFLCECDDLPVADGFAALFQSN